MSIEQEYTDEQLDYLSEYEKWILDDIKKEYGDALPVYQRIKFISFKSYSYGKGRKRKDPRIVELLVVDKKYAYVIEGYEVKPRKSHDRIRIDILANEVLSHLPFEERTVDNLLQLTMDKARK